MRVFAAIRPTYEVIKKISAYIEEMKINFPDIRVRWVPPENLHVTLRFEGDLLPADLDGFIDEISAVAAGFECFRLCVSETGAFVRYRGSVALWLGVRAYTDNEYHDIMPELVRYMSPVSSARLRRPTPHLTIARLKKHVNSEPLINRHLTGNIATFDFIVTEILVIKSELHSTGSVYSVIARIPLQEGSCT